MSCLELREADLDIFVLLVEFIFVRIFFRDYPSRLEIKWLVSFYWFFSLESPSQENSVHGSMAHRWLNSVQLLEPTSQCFCVTLLEKRPLPV
jgi:hypothetical protein